MRGASRLIQMKGKCLTVPQLHASLRPLPTPPYMPPPTCTPAKNFVKGNGHWRGTYGILLEFLHVFLSCCQTLLSYWVEWKKYVFRYAHAQKCVFRYAHAQSSSKHDLIQVNEHMLTCGGGGGPVGVWGYVWVWVCVDRYKEPLSKAALSWRGNWIDDHSS